MKNTSSERVFRGGIQRGTVATDAQASQIDNQVKTINQELFRELDIPGLTWQPKLFKHQQPLGNGPCAPDGGVWFYKGQAILASEAKKQGAGGNAIDRWFKNFNILKLLNPDISYVTFARGEGVIDGNPIHKTLYLVVEGKYNTIREKSDRYSLYDNVSVFLNVDGFGNNFIKEKIYTILMLALSKHGVVL